MGGIAEFEDSLTDDVARRLGAEGAFVGDWRNNWQLFKQIPCQVISVDLLAG